MIGSTGDVCMKYMWYNYTMCTVVQCKSRSTKYDDYAALAHWMYYSKHFKIDSSIKITIDNIKLPTISANENPSHYYIS